MLKGILLWAAIEDCFVRTQCTCIHPSVRVASRHSTVETTSAFLEVALSCDMAGYIHPDEDFQWYHNTTRLIGSKYTTTYTNGSNVAQYRGKETIPSRINTLTIRQLNISDAGTYTCRVEGTLAMAEVTLNINEPQSKSVIIT